MLSRYLDPKNDYSFKKIFGEEKHKRIPIDFLNAVFQLTDEKKIIDLEFLNPKQPPHIAARKESIVDVMVQDQKGDKYVIEMQVAKIEGFEKRAQYYAAKTYCAHFGRGGKYNDLKKVIFLAITDYIVFPKKENYKCDHLILDNYTHEHDLKDFSFTFIELPKFIKTIDELISIEDKWYYFLKHADESNDINEILAKHPEIKEAYSVLDRYHWTEEELQYYEKLMMNEADMHGTLEAAKKEGLQEGLQEGKKEGKREGLKEGKKEKTIEIASAMLEDNMPIEQISKLLGLSDKEIHSLKKTPKE
jgi:predicted transposase/invertase (TIGR01784 family)